jgi:hypothetical protein
MQKSHGMLDVDRVPVSSSKEKKDADSGVTRRSEPNIINAISLSNYEFMKPLSPKNNSVKSRFESGPAT